MYNLKKRKNLVGKIINGQISSLKKRDYYVLGLKPAQVFLLTTLLVRRVKVANQLHAMSDAELHSACTTYVNHISGSSYFPTPAPSLATCQTALDEFAATISDAANHDKAKVELKNAKRVQVMNLFSDLGNYVESCANDPVNAAVGPVAVIEEAAMRAKIFNPRGKQLWNVERGVNSGIIVMVLQLSKGRVHMNGSIPLIQQILTVGYICLRRLGQEHLLPA